MTTHRTTPPSPAFPLAVVEASGDHHLRQIDRDLPFDLYRAHGAVLLRGFAGDLDSFGAFAQHYCPVPIHNESGKRLVLDGASGVQSVNLGVRPFPLHPELSREPWRPDSAFFYCVKPPSSGGQTTVCDGVEIVRQLPDPLRREMAMRRIRYAVPASPADLHYWLGKSQPDEHLLESPPPNCPFTFERHEGRLMRCFTRPLLHRTRFQNDLAWGNFILFARYLRGVKTYPVLDDWSEVPDDWVDTVKEISDRLVVEVGWREGDLLMVDNSRFMHGRSEVVPGDGRMVATYFGYLANAEPDLEEPAEPAWRKPGFVPPQFAARSAA